MIKTSNNRSSERNQIIAIMKTSNNCVSEKTSNNYNSQRRQIIVIMKTSNICVSQRRQIIVIVKDVK